MTRRRQRGFTLLEVLVATLIMAIAVAGLLSNLSTSMRNASRLTDYDRATMLARRQMDEILALPKLPRNRLLEGRFDPVETGGQESGWRAEARLFEAPPRPGAGTGVLDRIELEVWWIAGGKRRTFLLESFRRSVMTPEDMAAQPVGQP